MANNTILEKTTVLDKAKHKFVTNYLSDEIKWIASSLSSELVDIQLKVEGAENYVVIKGRKDGMALAEEMVQDITDGIVCRDHDINKPGIRKYFGSKRGKDFIVAAESRHRVAIVLTTDVIEKAYTSAGRKRKLSEYSSTPLLTKVDDKTVVNSNGVKITLCTGGIETQQVDVIVNTTSPAINVTMGVSRAIFRAAGPGLVAETRQFVPLNHGSIAVTGGHLLQCNNIYHVSCGAWDGPNGNCERYIKQIIGDSLKTAAENGHRSIAFPAIGTGSNKVPIEKCAELLYYEVGNNSNTSVTEVRFVIYDNDTEVIKAFEAEMDRHTSLPQAGMDWNIVPATTSKPKKKRAAAGSSTTALFVKMDNMTLVTKNDVKITLCKGDIAAQQVDVIVNSTSTYIDTNSGVSGAIFRAAGLGLKKETLQLVPLSPGSIAITNGHCLHCSHIYHVSCRAWDGPNGKCEEFIKQIIAESMKAAAGSGHTSIAFPAIGTGINNVPTETCAELLYHEVAINPHTSVRDVRLVIYDKDTEGIKLFEAEMHRQARLSNLGLKRLLAGQSLHCNDQLGIHTKGRPNPVVRTKALGTSHPANKFLPQHGIGSKLRICAKTTAEIHAVIKEVDDVCKEELKETLMDSPTDQENIAKLNDMQIRRIHNLGPEHEVQVTIQRAADNKSIRVQGLSEDTLSVVQKIYEIFFANNSKEHARSQSELVKRQVQWYFEDYGDLTEFPEDTNAKIEAAFDLKMNEVEWTEQDGGKSKIDFKTMMAIRYGRARPRLKVHRKSKGGGVEVPPNWTPEDPNKDFELVTIPAKNPEYQDVEEKCKVSAAGNIIRIKSIQRVENRTLFQQYAVRKDRMVKTNPSVTVERLLWHGTSVGTIESIIRNGFNRSYAGKNAVAYGNGVYFAKNASYSSHPKYACTDPCTGLKHIFMCKVLTGEYVNGSSGMKVPPVKSGTILYDSVVDNVADPSIYVIFNDTQAYPEYLITFF